MEERSISRQTLQRLPLYLRYLRALPQDFTHISATAIAEGLGLGDVQVRKDLAAVSSGGKPRVGYVTRNLIADLEEFLGCASPGGVVVVGMGHLGKALTRHSGFGEYGQWIVAVFDADESLIGARHGGREILPVSSLSHVCRRLHVRIGVIAVPPSGAQEVCDRLVEGGVQAVWNFAPVHLSVPPGIVVQNENMAASLAALSRRVAADPAEGLHLQTHSPAPTD